MLKRGEWMAAEVPPSKGPVTATIRFVENTGKRVAKGYLEEIEHIVERIAGTNMNAG